MIKTWVNKALILAYVTLFCFLGISTKVNAERLFILDNIFTNGDIKIDADSNNIADDWNTASGSTALIVDEKQYFYGNNTSYQIGIRYDLGFEMIENHKYYLSFEFGTNWTPLNPRYVIQHTTQFKFDSIPFVNSYILTKTTTTIADFYIFLSDQSGVSIPSDEYIWFDNLMLFDLTALFGHGYEPSLQDFELYYLPDLDYFDTFNSFEPDMITSISDVNYTNLQENLTGIDYTKSIIDNDGKNIDLDLSLYFYDTVVNGTTITGIYTAEDYVNTNHPVMKYNNEIYTLNWVFSDYSQRVIILDLTDEQELILKKILFNRYIDRDNEYFNFKAETGFFSYAKMWFTIGSKFDLLVDVKSFLLSRETITQNDFNIINEMYIKTYDTDDNLLLPSLKMNIADLFRTVYVDDFGSQYTNISKFNFEFLITSPDKTDNYEFENHYFYEIGIFSSDKVLHPSFIKSDIDSLWEYKTCDWYQIGCHLSNFFNDVLTTIYNKLNIDVIIAFFDGIIDDVTQVVDTVPSGVKTVFAVLFTGLGVALIIVIIEKMNR